MDVYVKIHIYIYKFIYLECLKYIHIRNISLYHSRLYIYIYLFNIMCICLYSNTSNSYHWENGVHLNVARCEHEFSEHSVGAIGAPCVSHSKTSPVGFSMFFFLIYMHGNFCFVRINNHQCLHVLHPKTKDGKKGWVQKRTHQKIA